MIRYLYDSTVNMTLDLGCGHGFETYVEGKKNYTVGIDNDEVNIQQCRARYPGSIFAVMSAEQLAFQKSVFSKRNSFHSSTE